jgi:hypothetical protein
MATRTLVVLMVLGTVILSACGRGQSVPAKMDYTALRELKIEDVATDAQRALAAHDTRLLAVRGVAIEVPGAGDDVPSLEKKYGIKVISGTSDAIRSDEQRRLNDNARAYAKKYNAFILSSAKPSPQ